MEHCEYVFVFKFQLIVAYLCQNSIVHLFIYTITILFDIVQ